MVKSKFIPEKIKIMGVIRVTDQPTEADLESRIDTALRLAFPFLPRDALTHQASFSFKAGHSSITVDGISKKSANFRADILVNHKGRPIAVIELKRPGLPLTEEDNKQGLSYARVQFPFPPLVVVTNGKELRILETYTGKEWQPVEQSELAVVALIQSAARVAEHDVKIAIGILMGTDHDIWVQAVKQTSIATIAELTGSWGERKLPFVGGFLIPRKATVKLKELIRSGERMAIVHGPPMIGKSSVLREFSLLDDAEYAVLFIESDGEVSIVQQVADLLEQQLDWPISKEEARRWLRGIARGDGPALVIVIDGINLNIDSLRDEISDLCSDAFGKKLILVFELDEALKERVIHDSSGRRESKIGRKACSISVKPLDYAEFWGAVEVLFPHRIVITKGGHLTPEYRIPWILRTLGMHLMAVENTYDVDSLVGIPPVLSLNLLSLAREEASGKHELRRRLRGLANAVVDDAQRRERSSELSLEAVAVFAVLRTSAEGYLSDLDLKSLEEEGLVKPVFLDSGEAVFLIQVPELIASEVAFVLAEGLKARENEEGLERALWLEEIAGAIPFGDVVAAQSMLDLARKGGGISISLISALLNHEPSDEILGSGSEFILSIPGGGMLTAKIKDDGVSMTDSSGEEQFIPIDLDSEPFVVGKNYNGWLILSHIAAIAFEVVDSESGSVLGRGDTGILLRVGACPSILRRPTSVRGLDRVGSHEVDGDQVVCHKEGIVEVITNSIYVFLAREIWNSEKWIDEVVARNSMALFARVHIALSAGSASADKEFAKFAVEMLEAKISPAFSDCCSES